MSDCIPIHPRLRPASLPKDAHKPHEQGLHLHRPFPHAAGMTMEDFCAQVKQKIQLLGP